MLECLLQLLWPFVGFSHLDNRNSCHCNFLFSKGFLYQTFRILLSPYDVGHFYGSDDRTLLSKKQPFASLIEFCGRNSFIFSTDAHQTSRILLLPYDADHD